MKKAAITLLTTIAIGYLWLQLRDDRVYMCRPTDASDCVRNQFGSFSSIGMCEQAAEAFCFDEHYRYGNKGGFACVQNGDIHLVAYCNETEIEIRYTGTTTPTRQPY